MKICCNKCEREATFEIPENLCSRHWAEWWTEEYEHDMSPSEKEEIIQEILEMHD